jgi:nanoRNase/pAp phosphatase (c-di-AMP/oligoRNAs hydrolase)
LAESFNGGGHVGASSFYMKKQEWRKLMFEWLIFH